MQAHEQKNKELHLKLDLEGLNPSQVRVLKSIHSLLAGVVTAEDEAEYFQMSAELMKKTAELIKQSNFALEHKSIAYGDQALEFSVDTLNESMEETGAKNLDN
jgi:hypothetical protein